MQIATNFPHLLVRIFIVVDDFELNGMGWQFTPVVFDPQVHLLPLSSDQPARDIVPIAQWLAQTETIAMDVQ
ncbi:hypothetical protein [Pseudomonas sp. KK4]|uniref:hypothetical protein n=1 Tax=Pseudomonas sp. KK4 TaxID=1855729 RepID=UPI00158A59E7|nr:hypothetical protein [Pseudomonas sp. KK4]